VEEYRRSTERKGSIFDAHVTEDGVLKKYKRQKRPLSRFPGLLTIQVSNLGACKSRLKFLGAHQYMNNYDAKLQIKESIDSINIHHSTCHAERGEGSLR
jgi:hypothetical protein